MVFSGQGAQWPEMGRDILLKDPEFRKDIAEMGQILQSLIHPPSWTLAGKTRSRSQSFFSPYKSCMTPANSCLYCNSGAPSST
ncbi:hypothetical protein OCU04_004157 [Sclerotinia nivalis]|uniref:Malonyl-CoA:ACP transacylase (MAT) domain-containing protein n=1 Tax=Sclerotinia nivalis TaxID=352851 RepID=A0A9X0DKV2_9HELO|nr:hypothetical protein OCU04_004157 [Sclerotinia nivalis]